MKPRPLYVAAEDVVIMQMFQAGKPWAEIAQHLDRPFSSVRKRARSLGCRRPSTRPRRDYQSLHLPADGSLVMRKCLGRCGLMFPSQGAHNRICPNCAKLDVYSGFATMALTVGRRG